MATVGLIGLGRMGGNMARRWQQHGVNVIAFNRNHDVTKSLATECGLVAATSIEQLVQQLPAPRVVWMTGAGRCGALGTWGEDRMKHCRQPRFDSPPAGPNGPMRSG